MKVNSKLTDESILQELGARLAGVRLERNLTQAALAEKAGVSKSTVERLESGEVAPQLSGFIRICRALDLLDRLDAFIPEKAAGPIALLKSGGRKRQRATGSRKKTAAPSEKWTWGETK